MKTSIFKVIALAVFLCACAVTTVSAFVDRVLVIVNDDVITQSEFDYRMLTIAQDFKAKSQPIPPELPKQLLDSMVNDLVQVQEANRRGITISNEELAAAITRFATQQNVTVEQLKVQINESGQPFQMFQDSVRDSMTISRFTDYYARSRVVVPDYEVKGTIEANKLDQDTSEYKVAHILIKDPDNNVDLAQRVRDEIESGLSFEEAVMRYSEGDKQNGGLIGWRVSSSLPEVFVDAVKQLQAGEVTPVVKSANGLHILKLLDLKSDRTEIVQSNVRHILISAESQVAKSQAAKKLYALRSRIEKGEEFSTLARIFSDDSVSAANGGSLGWVSPGQMVAPFEKAFEVLPIGQLSQPIGTRYGMHLLVVEDRRKKNITDEIIYAQVEDRLRRERADREYKQWIRELLEGAYVEHLSEPNSAVL